MFPTAGSWSLNWSLDINIYNLSVQTNIILAHKIALHLQPLNSQVWHIYLTSTQWSSVTGGIYTVGTRMCVLYMYVCNNIHLELEDFKNI